MATRTLLWLTVTAAPALAQPTPAARRFPQPVLVGTLIGHDVLEPKESQPVLGHVAAIVRRPDGGLDMVMRTGRALGLDTRLVAVPAGAVALLGDYVAVMDLTPAQLRALPTVPDPAAPLPSSETIRLGIVRPFH